MTKKHFDTLAIHAGNRKNEHRALNTPIYMTSTFTFDNIQQADDTFDFKSDAYVYTRGRNPTIDVLEQRMATLEEGQDAIAFASGMAAITTVLLSLVKKEEIIIAHRNLYGSTFAALTNIFPRFGIQTKFVDMTDLNSLKAISSEKTKVFYFETPTNPSLEIIDIEEVCKIAKEKNIKVVVDNTFATPYFQKPLTLGADVVIHSATKYISGHGDVVAGIAVSKDKDYSFGLRFGFMCELGGIISPFNAWLLLRGLKTLSLRMKKHEENAQAIVAFLSSHGEVEKILYPALTSHPHHDIAKKQMSGFGGIVSFKLKGDFKRAKAFVEKLKLHKLAVSLGDAESLVEIPALMTHRAYPEEKLKEFGFSKKTIRISTGIENKEDIIEDIKQAIE